MMKTKSGKLVKNLTFSKGIYTGIVDNKVMTWDVTGKRNPKNKSKNDLTIDKVVIVYRTGKHIVSRVVDREYANWYRVIKTYEL